MILRGVLICLLLTVSWASALAHWACTTQESTCKLVFVVHDTWHAAIVLPKSDIALDSLPELVDFPDAEFIEFSWGDKDYFPDPNAGIFTGIKAAFWSSGAVLHVVGFSADVRSFYRSGELVELRLAVNAHARLLDYISDTYGFCTPKTDIFGDCTKYSEEWFLAEYDAWVGPPGNNDPSTWGDRITALCDGNPQCANGCAKVETLAALDMAYCTANPDGPACAAGARGVKVVRSSLEKIWAEQLIKAGLASPKK